MAPMALRDKKALSSYEYYKTPFRTSQELEFMQGKNNSI